MPDFCSGAVIPVEGILNDPKGYTDTLLRRSLIRGRRAGEECDGSASSPRARATLLPGASATSIS